MSKIYLLAKNLKDAIQGKAKLRQKRSPLWRSVRSEFLRDNASCAVCGSKKFLEVHHIEPFNEAPERELDLTNLITLCDGTGKYGLKSCHMLVGHSGNFRKKNPDVLRDAEYLNKKIKG